jgi:hypothetical protein
MPRGAFSCVRVVRLRSGCRCEDRVATLGVAAGDAEF